MDDPMDDDPQGHGEVVNDQEANRVMDLSHMYEQLPGLRGERLDDLTEFYRAHNVHAWVIFATRNIWYVDGAWWGLFQLRSAHLRHEPQAIYNLNVSKAIFRLNPQVQNPMPDMSSFATGGPHRHLLTQCRTNMQKMLSAYVLHRAPGYCASCEWQTDDVHTYDLDPNAEHLVTCAQCVLDIEAQHIRYP